MVCLLSLIMVRRNGVGLNLKKYYFKKRKAPFLISCLILLLLFFIGSYFLNYINIIELKMYGIEQSVIYSKFHTINSKNRELDLNKVLNNDTQILQQVFCVIDNKSYFSYSYYEDSICHWCLSSVNNDGSQLKTLFDAEFSMNYKVNLSESYSKRNGYYFDGKIILTDFKKLIEYDIQKGVYTELSYDKYIHPETPISWKFGDDFNSITFFKNGKKYYLDKTILSQNNNIARQIISKNNHDIWSGDSPFNGAFGDVQIVNDEVFLILLVRNYHGSSYAIIFKLDFDNSKYSYLGYEFIGGTIFEREFHIVATNQSEQATNQGTARESNK